MSKLGVFVCIGVLIAFAALPSLARATPCMSLTCEGASASGNYGCALGSFQNVTAYSNGDWTGSGDCGEYQCVEFVRRFYRTEVGRTLGTLSPIYASEAFSDWPQNSGLTAYTNGVSTTPPAPGDIYCQSGNTAGHVGIIKTVNLTSMAVEVIDQNRSSSSATLTRTLYVDGQGRYRIQDLDGVYQSGTWETQGWLRDPNYNPSLTYSCSVVTNPAQDPQGQFNAVRGLLRQYTLRFKNKGQGTTWTSAAGANQITLVSWDVDNGVETTSFLNNPYDASLNWMDQSSPYTVVCTMQEATVAYDQTATFTFWGRVPWNADLGVKWVYFRPKHATGGALPGWGGAAFQSNVVQSKRLDFDGDGVADVWDRTAGGLFHLDYASDNLDGWDWTGYGYGGSSDTPCPADYDGDGKWDFAMLRNSDGKWFIDYAANGFGAWDVNYGGYGSSADYPCSADFDGDGMADISVRDADGDWHIDYAHDGFGGWNNTYGGYGGANDRPAPADYDGDHKADMAVLRNSDRKYLIDYAANGFVNGWDETGLGGYGGIADYPCPADYDGDGKADIAVLWTGDGTYRIDHSSGGFGAWAYILGGYGGTGDRPMPADYDGDGRDDIGVYHASVSRVCFDFWNYQGNTGWTGWNYCDTNHPPYAPKAPEGRSVPLAFTVDPNRPNPFNPRTTIRYSLPAASRVTIEVFNVQGQRVATLVDANQSAGPHEAVWDAKGFASGIYLYRLTAGSHRASGRMVLLK